MPDEVQGSSSAVAARSRPLFLAQRKFQILLGFCEGIGGECGCRRGIFTCCGDYAGESRAFLLLSSPACGAHASFNLPVSLMVYASLGFNIDQQKYKNDPC